MATPYNQVEISKFLSLIEIPSRFHLHNNPPRNIAFLTALHTHMISTVPYENLTIHYSRSHTISLDPQVLFQKIVLDGRGRGGYCMENSLFFNLILRGLGFRAFPVGVRIRHRIDGIPQGDYIGWVHIVNIVTLEDGTRWSIDVGFGGDGATKPLPLVEGHITRNLGTQDIRFIRDYIPGQTERTPERKLWTYQYRNSEDKPWNSFYAFSDQVEFLWPDYNIMNWYTGSSPESFQTFTVLVVKFLRRLKSESSQEYEIYGKRTLSNGTVKENLGGKTQIVQECASEEERVTALKKWFGMVLTEEERDSIVGFKTELRVKDRTASGSY